MDMRKFGAVLVIMGLFFFGWTNIYFPAVLIGFGILTIIFDNNFKL